MNNSQHKPHNETIEELWNIVKSIPFGKVASYGQIGRMLTRPVSGLIVGKWMSLVSDEGDRSTVPWWRVIGAKGELLIAKRGPHFFECQRDCLNKEGILLENGMVPMHFFWDGDTNV